MTDTPASPAPVEEIASNSEPTPENQADSMAAAKQHLVAVLHRDMSWLLWITGLSMVNAVLALSHSDFYMALGLGITMGIDVAFEEIRKSPEHHSINLIIALNLVIDLLLCAPFLLCTYFGRRGSRVAIVIAVILLGLDGLLLLGPVNTIYKLALESVFAQRKE